MWHAKPKKRRCNCRKRRHGSPKIPTGICHGSKYRDAVAERIAGKRAVRDWRDDE